MSKSEIKSNKGEFDGAELVGTVSTFYTDGQDPRFELALANAELWRDKGLPFFVIDGSPMQDTYDTWVVDALRERGAVTERAKVNGIATQRQQGVRGAIERGATKVVGHEPEKVQMSYFSREIAAGLDKHAILVIGRTALAEASLPTAQRFTENMAGWVLERAHHLPADTLSGGRGFTQAGANILAQYPAMKPNMNNWIYLYTTLIAAREQGLSVGGIKVDLMHPATMVAQEQGDETFDRKRYDQFRLQLDHLLNMPGTDPDADPIVQAVKSAIAGLSLETPNKEFEEQLKKLSARLHAFGYTSPDK